MRNEKKPVRQRNTFQSAGGRLQAFSPLTRCSLRCILNDVLRDRRPEHYRPIVTADR